MTAILVTGSTGTLGRAVVPRLADAGHRVRSLSRRPPPPASPAGAWATGDLRRNVGLDQAVAGMDVIVHCASAPRGDPAAARNLIAAARRAGAPHLVYISIAGIDQVPLGYYKAKLATERLIEASGLPWTILRATQFHDLSLVVMGQMAKLPVIPVPAGVRFQPVDTDEVAARLVELALGAPAGLVPDVAGPQVSSMADLLRTYLRARGKHRLLVPVRLPGHAARAVRAGANLAPGRAVGHRTWEEFLAERVPAPA